MVYLAYHQQSKIDSTMRPSLQVDDIPAQFQQYLVGPEKILWTGRPVHSPFNRPLPGLDLWFVPLGFLILLLSIGSTLGFASYQAQSAMDMLSVLIPGLIFPGLIFPGLISGSFLVIYPFLHRYWELPNTYYALTDVRALILFTMPHRSLIAFFLDDITIAQTIANRNEIGTIAFELANSSRTKYSKFWFVNVSNPGSIVTIVDKLRSNNALDSWKKEIKLRFEKDYRQAAWQRILVVMTLLLMAAGGLALYSKIQADSSRRRQEFAKSPHTVRILGYQVTFPKEIPDGYNAGRIDLDYSDLTDCGKGKEGRTRRATLDLWPPEQSPFPGRIQFVVNEFGQPGRLPDDWQAPEHWKRLHRTSLGIKEIAGVKFAVTHSTAELYYWPDEKNALDKENFLPNSGYKISAVEYLAHDYGKMIGLRGYGYGDDNVILDLTDSAFKTFRKVKFPPPAVDLEKDFPDIDLYKTASGGEVSPADTVDRYAELTKP